MTRFLFAGDCFGFVAPYALDLHATAGALALVTWHCWDLCRQRGDTPMWMPFLIVALLFAAALALLTIASFASR